MLGDCKLLSHHLANSGANTIIKSEFKIANQVIGTSVDVACDSLYILNIMIPQTIIKLKPRTKFENRISEKVFLKKAY